MKIQMLKMKKGRKTNLINQLKGQRKRENCFLRYVCAVAFGACYLSHSQKKLDSTLGDKGKHDERGKQVCIMYMH